MTIAVDLGRKANKQTNLKDVGYIFLNFPKTSQGENNGTITANVQTLHKLH